MEVVGVVGDVRGEGPAEAARARLYMPMAQQPLFPFMNVAIRTTVDPATLAAPLRQIVADLNPVVPVSNVRVMEDLVGAAVARPRMTAWVMGLFAALAATLAAVGLYGVLSFTVSKRIREIGIRIALGAQPQQVVGHVVGSGMTLAGLGLGLGLVGAFAAGRIMEGILFGVAARDATTMVAATGFLAAVALAACLIPAWRAARVAPARSLVSD
jgi:ABC-type antimicrobial peptide transport system permease subunit